VPSVDFYFDVVCPYAYLAHRRIAALCEAEGARLAHRPILLGGVFRAIGAPDAPMDVMSDSKRSIGARDLERWSARLEMPLRKPEGHPRKTVLAMRAIHAAGDRRVDASRALFAAYWRDGRDVEDAGVVRGALADAGLDGEAIVRAAETDETKAALRAETDAAVRAGVFGVPTFVVTSERGAQVFWGQDRLEFVRKAIRGWWIELPSDVATLLEAVGAAR
jgi:2-hydroxychromene-2-carboxylate isomerase